MKRLLNKIRSWFIKDVPTDFSNSPTTTIQVLVGDKVVGAIQSLSVKDNSEDNYNKDLSVQRIRFNRLQIEEAFSRGFLNKNTQRFPLQIKIIDDKKVITIQNVWISNMTYSYTANDWVIVEYADMVAETMFSKKK